MATYFSLLGINHNATQREIRMAYIKKAKEHHPDKNFGQNKHDFMSKLNHAYKVLINNEKGAIDTFDETSSNEAIVMSGFLAEAIYPWHSAGQGHESARAGTPLAKYGNLAPCW